MQHIYYKIWPGREKRLFMSFYIYHVPWVRTQATNYNVHQLNIDVCVALDKSTSLSSRTLLSIPKNNFLSYGVTNKGSIHKSISIRWRSCSPLSRSRHIWDTSHCYKTQTQCVRSPPRRGAATAPYFHQRRVVITSGTKLRVEYHFIVQRSTEPKPFILI